MGCAGRWRRSGLCRGWGGRTRRRYGAGRGEDVCPEEALRGQGLTDEDVTRVIRSGGQIQVSAEEIASYYATPEERGRRDG